MMRIGKYAGIGAGYAGDTVRRPFWSIGGFIGPYIFTIF